MDCILIEIVKYFLELKINTLRFNEKSSLNFWYHRSRQGLIFELLLKKLCCGMVLKEDPLQ